ncbi:MAG TPA: hypothetical protein VL381_00710 [Rhodocyclaceae bacterium]|jgi:hypothetical protein|nr:hypothetical protein [Rhodocyclaceae bacterium]
MKVFKYLRLAVLFCGLLMGMAACKVEVSPIETATVKSLTDGRVDKSWALSESQVVQLNKWLADNQGGWDVVKSQYVPNLLVNARHRDGHTSTIGISSKHIVIGFNGEQHVQKFDREDIQALQLIVGGI